MFKRLNIGTVIKSYSFVILLLIGFFACDLILTGLNPVGKLDVFEKNDFERVRALHPEKVYKNVLFGNSGLLYAFDETLSNTDYINMGIVYGKMTDLRAILQESHARISDNLVLVLNYFVFMDSLPSNPTYSWHKKIYLPYPFFQRDRLRVFFEESFNNVLDGRPAFTPKSMEKEYFHTTLSSEELEEKAGIHKRDYWGLSIDHFDKNMQALADVMSFCQKNNIRLRAVWLPWNYYTDVPEIAQQVQDKANQILVKDGIEILNLLDSQEKYPPSAFYDLGHFKYEEGTTAFTKELDAWLNR